MNAQEHPQAPRLTGSVTDTRESYHDSQCPGYHDHYCFLPLYVFCGKQLLVSYLRPSKIDGAKRAWAFPPHAVMIR